MEQHRIKNQKYYDMQRGCDETRNIPLPFFAEPKPDDVPQAVRKHQDTKETHQSYSQGKYIYKKNAKPESIEQHFEYEKRMERHLYRRESFMEAGVQFFRGMEKLKDDEDGEDLF